MPDSALAAAVLAGLLGGVHCLAMCGAYVAIVQAGGSPESRPLRPARVIVRELACAHAGRITAYALAGAVFGALGGTVYAAGWVGLQRTLYVAANLLLLAVAASLVRRGSGSGLFERVGLGIHRRIAPVFASAVARHSPGARYALGVLWGFTPCALVYGMLPLALLSGGAWQGALILVVFGVSTLPNLIAAGWVWGRAQRRLDRKAFRWAAALALAVFAGIGLWRALGPAEGLAQGPYCLVR
ncbi:MAG: sulfite exporter TauE/SafE family protein [Burkholderiales bacterium]|nr:sulfite exporter TauE/SafE family protein [Burkholderiales bacterium]